MRKTIVNVSLLTLLWLVLTAAEPGSEPDPKGEFIDVVNVDVVNVDVYVTDKKGGRITGLGREDFEVFEDGRPVEITNFYTVAGRPQRGGALAPTAEVADLDTGPWQPQAVPEDQQLHLVIYVDNVNIHPLNRQKCLAPVRSFVLTGLGPEDRAMVVSYDRSLHQRQAFTADKRLVTDALIELEDLTGHRTQYDKERNALLDDIYDARSIGEVDGRVRMWADRTYDDANRSIDALAELVEALAGLPGRKAILYVSDGLAMRAGEDLFYALDDKFANDLNLLQINNYGLERRFKTVTHQASSSRITFYTLDAAGMRTHANADVINYHPGRGNLVESSHVANLQAPLRFLADETGGQAIVNTNNFRPLLQRISDDFDSYYSLGYVAPVQGSGRFRSIEVRVKNRDRLRIRHRQGYRDKTVRNRMSQETLAALSFGYQKNELGVEIGFSSGVPEDNAFLVSMVIKIPMGKLVFIPRDQVQRANLRLYIAARDDQGKLAPVQELEVPIEIPQELFARARQQSYRLTHTLMMDAGRQMVAVGVRDEIGALTSFVLGGVHVGT